MFESLPEEDRGPLGALLYRQSTGVLDYLADWFRFEAEYAAENELYSTEKMFGDLAVMMTEASNLWKKEEG